MNNLLKMVLSQNYCCGSCFAFFRKLYIYSVLRTNHYKVLGLTPSATQSEIKSAYYELSKKHHPDKNQGSETSAKMFRSITAAYEILGNEKLRKKYDETHRFNEDYYRRGFESSQRGDYNDDIERMYYERRNKQFSKKYYYWKTPHFDYYTWYKAHYGKNSHFDGEFWNSKKGSYDFEKWEKSNFQRNKKFIYKTYSLRQNADELKKREKFIYKVELYLLIGFYLVLFLALFFNL